MAFRRPALVVFVVAALTAALTASAGPNITPQVLQCDGSYSPGSPGTTRHPTPLLRADITDTTGLRVAPSRMGPGPYPGAQGTRGLWRFNGGVSVSLQCNLADTSCNGGPCLVYNYIYTDTNGSDPLIVGKCIYDNSVSMDCATNDGPFSSPLVPMGQAGCPTPNPPPVGANTLFTTAGQFGQAGHFTGVHAASATDSGTWDRPADYTLSAWIRSGGAGYQRILSQQDPASPGQYWGFGLNNGALWHFDSRDSAPAASLGSGLTNGAWHKVDIVRINGNKRYFYIDGAQIGSAVATSTDSFANHRITNALFIGAYAGGGNNFVGDIDEVRIMDTALSADEIMLEYQGTFHKYSSDGGVSYSTVAASFITGPPQNGTQTTSTYTPTEPWTSNSRWIFAAQSTNTASTVLSPYAFSIDQSSPSAVGLSGSAGTDQLTWSWGVPAKVCQGTGLPVYYELMDARTGLSTASALGASPYVEPAAGANLSQARQVRVHDHWGFSPLSASVTAYTLAAVPSPLALTNISTGGVSVSWGANGNQTYTRYELTYSPDDFLTTTSTRVAMGNNFTTLATNLTGLAMGTTYYLRVRAFNGQASDFSGGIGTSLTGQTRTFVTRPAAPVLTGTALTDASVRWDWTHPSGASGYTLYDAPTGGQMTSGAAITYTSATLSVNVRYGATVEAYVPEPGYATPNPTAVGAKASAYVYTLSTAPTSPVVSAMYRSSGVFSWNANGNPAYTNYELSVATDSNFNVVVATLGALGTSAAVTDLLPGTSYYARIRAFNGDQIPAPPNSFVVFTVTMTVTDPRITVSPAPASPYVAPAGLAGVWQFDEGSGLTSADGSGTGNTANLTCIAPTLCTSTPTFASGPPGLGTAASFSGSNFGVAVTQNNFPAFNDDLTVEAWVYPQSASQGDYSGLVAVGSKDSEVFALDIVSNHFRFLATPGKSASAALPIAANAWTHVVGVFDSVAGTATLYLNGAASAPSATSVPLRINSSQTLSIGNRLNTGAYSLPFYGRVDSVRVLHRALKASEVLSDYQGSFVSTVTPSSPNNGVLVGLPPNAITSPVQFYISADPAAHPIKISYAALNAGLAALPAGLTLVPNSVVEVVPVVAGMPYTAPLGSSATISIPFADSNNNNLVDGTLLSAAGIRMYTLNTTVNRWEALNTSVDPVNHRAVGLTPHFSLFALLAPSTIGAGLSGVRIYPVPWKPGSGGRFDGPGLTFDHLPASGQIHILTLAGENVADLSFDGHAAGLTTWDGRTKQGRRCASGVYFAKIVADAGGSMIVKFAIER